MRACARTHTHIQYDARITVATENHLREHYRVIRNLNNNNDNNN